MRTRTPPHLKWLLNERAALAGEAQEVEKRIQGLQQKLAAVTEKIAALDSVMAQYDARLRPDAAGTVRATGKRYGGWGGLRRYLLEHLKQAAPATVNTKWLAMGVAANFQISLESSEETTLLVERVRRQLNLLKKDGVVESFTQPRGLPNEWRIKGTAPSWEALVAANAAAAVSFDAVSGEK